MSTHNYLPGFARNSLRYALPLLLGLVLPACSPDVDSEKEVVSPVPTAAPVVKKKQVEARKPGQPKPYHGDLATVAKINVRDVTLSKVVGGLKRPWAFEFVGDDEVIITEFAGKLSIFNLATKEHRYIGGMPQVASGKPQTGLLDVEVHPDFNVNKRIYFSYVVANEDDPPKYATAAATGVLENGKITQLKQFLLAEPFEKSPSNFGGAIEIDDEGYLFLGVGDRSNRGIAQKADRLQGKILRFKLDTLQPEKTSSFDNPDADRRIYAMGVRNPQGLHFDRKTGRLFETEHGPMGGDEVNVIAAGVNFGWPRITYGRNYTDESIGEGTHSSELEQPLFYYLPSRAISPITVYRGAMFPEWEGHLLVGALSGQHISKIHLDEGAIRSEQAILAEIKGRIRDVKVARDGSVYVLAENGNLFRLFRPDNTGKAVLANPGKKTYQSVCSSCHDAGVGGAPRIGSKDDWRPVLEQRSVEEIINNALTGYNAMPARGMCEDCSDKDIEMAVTYILGQTTY